MNNSVVQFTDKQLAVMKEAEKVEEFFLNFEQTPCPVRHIFGPGIYIREVTLPAGVYAVGHAQNFEHLNILLKGKVKIYNGDGTHRILEGPMTFIGQPGKKVGYVIEEAVWQNVYADTETDVAKLEAKYLTKSEVSTQRQQQLLTYKDKHEEDRKDFLEAIAELGFTEEQVREQSCNREDHVDLPFGVYKFQTGPSLIEGTGVFATADIAKGEFIGPSRIGLNRTVLGSTVNHSKVPNARMVRDTLNNIHLVAIKDIFGTTGAELGEEITVNYRQSVALIKELQCQE